MSTTTKEEKPSILDELKAQAAAIAAKIKEATDSHLATLHEKLAEAHKTVQSITAEIQKHSGNTAPVKRGRKAGIRSVGNGKPAKASKKNGGKAKRGAVGEVIAKYLASKGKAGAHVRDIAAHIKNKPANVTAFFYSSGGKAKYKNLGKATFALKK